MEDRRCKLGLQGRLELVRLVEQGATFRQAAACLGVAPATAHRWWHRWRAASLAERGSLACLRTRSTRPRSCPWALSEDDERAILDARAKTNWGPMRLTWLTGRPRSTCWKVLHRHGVSRQRRSERPQTTRRYEWAEAGALLHIDGFELPKFDRPGHWAHGDRSEPHRTRKAGRVKVIGVVDDHTRLAYCEIHAGETADAVSATLTRAAAWMTERRVLREQPFVPGKNAVGLDAREASRERFGQVELPRCHRRAQAQPERIQVIGACDADEVVHEAVAATGSCSRRLP